MLQGSKVQGSRGPRVQGSKGPTKGTMGQGSKGLRAQLRVQGPKGPREIGSQLKGENKGMSVPHVWDFFFFFLFGGGMGHSSLWLYPDIHSALTTILQRWVANTPTSYLRGRMV